MIKKEEQTTELSIVEYEDSVYIIPLEPFDSVIAGNPDNLGTLMIKTEDEFIFLNLDTKKVLGWKPRCVLIVDFDIEYLDDNEFIYAHHLDEDSEAAFVGLELEEPAPGRILWDSIAHEAKG